MDTYFGAKPTTPTLIESLRAREIGDSSARRLVKKRNVTDDLVSRLGLEKELEGHQGCVNCLQWSDNGQILASTSDDMYIFLWNPFSYKKLCSFYTHHTGNIFTVNFMPMSNNNIVVSGAADARVKVFNLTLSEVLYGCSCHTSRVKRIASAKNMPYLFWSAAEDGLVLQHDLRIPHNCNSEHKSVLVDLAVHMGRSAEAKCVTINPVRPEQVAVGANDPYIRLFDRRMIKVAEAPLETFTTIEMDSSQSDSTASPKRNPGENMSKECATYYIAGHLCSRSRTIVATYVTFSSDGTELLANMGGEQIYLFDTTRPRYNRLFEQRVPSTDELDGHRDSQNLQNAAYGRYSSVHEDYPAMDLKVLPPEVEEIKTQATNEFQKKKYTLAINLFNKALSICPASALLYDNRAASFIKRKWDGDIYAALRDSQTALLLDPKHINAHFRLARCLFELDRPLEASRVMGDFEEKYPDCTWSMAYRALQKDVLDAAKSGLNTDELDNNTSSFEREWRRQSHDYKSRYWGHCNTTTDIKEANFFGSEGQYIIAGSDDGNIFIWDRYTTNIERVLMGDSRIVNCLQPHPSSCFLATSGIDSVIRLWSPLPEDDKPNKRAIKNTDAIAKTNQLRMNRDPFTLLLTHMGINYCPAEDDESDVDEPTETFYRTCRTS